MPLRIWNICTGKFDARPDYPVFLVGVDADKRSQRGDGLGCGQLVLQGGGLALQRGVAGLEATDLALQRPTCVATSVSRVEIRSSARPGVGAKAAKTPTETTHLKIANPADAPQTTLFFSPRPVFD